MKILQIVTLASPSGAFGGPLRVAMEQSQGLAQAGHEVSIAGLWDGAVAPDTLDGVPFVGFPARTVFPGLGFSGLISAGLFRWMFRELGKFELVHVHAGRDLVSLAAMATASQKRIRYIVQTHGMVGTDPRFRARCFDSIGFRRLLEGAGAVLTLTDAEREALGVIASKARLERLRNGVRPDSAPLAQNRPEEIPNVLFCGRLHPRKRPEVVVELAAAARRAGIEATFSLVGPDSGSLSRVESTIRDYGLERTVTYEGPVAYDAVRSRMRGSQVFVLPSVDEPFPMSLLEAMSVGLAPVCTTSCGIADELKRCGGAVVADPSVDRFIEAALPVLSDPMLRRELSEKARACAEASFPWRSVIATLESVYAG